MKLTAGEKPKQRPLIRTKDLELKAEVHDHTNRICGFHVKVKGKERYFPVTDDRQYWKTWTQVYNFIKPLL
jgi:hypothetical protein